MLTAAKRLSAAIHVSLATPPLHAWPFEPASASRVTPVSSRMESSSIGFTQLGIARVRAMLGVIANVRYVFLRTRLSSYGLRLNTSATTSTDQE